MKYKKYLLSLLIVLTSLFSFAESEGPGEPGGTPGLGDPPLGGGAPIGSGILILLGMGAAYGGYKLKKKNIDETSETNN